VRGRIVCILLIVLVASSYGAAQIVTGTIEGVVTDPSGAVVPGVAISVKNLDTNAVRTAITNETGNYLVSLLPVGRYEVSAELTGFRTQVKSGLTLQVEQRINVNFVLEVGAVTDTLLVTESAPLVQANTATIGAMIDPQKLVELPLNGRRFSSIGTLLPTATRMASESTCSTDRRDMFSVAGLPARYNNYMLDGVGNNDNAINMAAIKPSMDSVAEYRILTGTYSAEYGRGGGAQINVVTKSGTNQFHGTAYEFYRNSAMDAKNFFDNPNAPIPTFWRHQPGFSLGGPIVHDKTFFFIADEVLRLDKSFTHTTQVPLPAMKQGDFSALLQPNNIFSATPIIIKDPFNNNTPFPGNIIPANRIDPTGFVAANVYPDPNQPGKINFVAAPVDDWRWHQPSLRIDHKLSEKDNLLFRWSDNVLRTKYSYSGSSDLPGFGNLSRMHSDNGILSDTHVFSSRVIDEIRLGYNFFHESYPGEKQRGGYDYTALLFGIKTPPRNQQDVAGYPQFSIQGFSSYGDGTPNTRSDHTFEIYDGVSWLKGNHALKFGGMVKRVRSAIYPLTNPRGNFTFKNTFTGYSLADVLLGLPVQVALNTGDAQVYLRSNAMHLFVQDDWKFSQRLTVNLGLRWEINQQPYEKHNHRSSFNPATGLLELAGVNGVPRGLAPTALNDLAPRVGLAYNLSSDGRTIMRAGYGVYFNQIAWADFLTANATPWTTANVYVSSTTHPDITMRDPFPTTLGTTVLTPYAEDPHLRYPYIQQWSFGLQRQLGENNVIEVSYLGNKGSKQNIKQPINQAIPGPGDRNAVNARRPFPTLPNLSQLQSSGNMDYNAMAVRFERRFSAGLTFNTSYTWGKAIADVATPNMLNKRLGHGPEDIDNRQRLVSSFLYELPFGPAKRFASGSGPVGRIVGGWQFAGALVLRSGQTFTPSLSTDVSNTASGTDRPDAIGNARIASPDPRVGWWNRAAFAMPAPYTFGTAGTGILIGPDFKNLDFSLQKVTKITEAQRFEFRAEFFNITNHPNFASPNTKFDSALFGTLSSALDAREIQLGFKYIF